MDLNREFQSAIMTVTAGRTDSRLLELLGELETNYQWLLDTTNPGGLGFIGNSVFAFTPVLLAHARVLAGSIAARIWHEGTKLPAFQMEIAGEVVLLMAVMMAPLTFFVLPLARGKRTGAREYGLLAMQYVDDFREKWIVGGAHGPGAAGGQRRHSVAG